MTLSITLSPQVETTLRERATAAGKDPSDYASQIVAQAVARPSLVEILAPLRAEFAASRTSDDELLAQATAARDAYRERP